MKSEPKIRFPEFDDSYSCSYLSDYLTVNTARNKDGAYSKEDVLSVSGEEGIVNQIQLLGRSYAGVSVLDYHIVNPDDIVYTKSPLKASPFGIIKCNKGQSGIVSTLYAVYTPKESVLPSYVEDYFALDSRLNRYLKPIVRIGAKHDMKVSNSAVLEGEVSFPSLSEQKKIADFLSAYDKKISLQKERVKKLEERKKGLLQKVFSQEIRFKADDGSEFPEWENKTIGDICDALTGFPFESKGFVKKGVRLLRGMNVKRGYIDFSDDITAFWKNTDELNSYILQENDFIIQMDGALVGKSFGLLKSNQTPALLVQRVTRLRSESPITTKYIFQYFSSGAFDSAMMLQQTNSAVPHISLNDIKRFSLPYPSEIEQRKIVIFLETIDTQISLEKEKLATMQEIKKGLLQQMFC